MSGIKFLLDTNFILGLLKSQSEVLAEISERKLSIAECGYSAVTRMELLGFPGISREEESLIRQKLERLLYMGNIDALRDWGHAKDYVRMQWLMLQQDQPEDFVIATGVQYSARSFLEKTATALGMQLRWEGEGANEVGYWTNHHCERSAAIREVPIIKIDPRYFRPTEVETLLGDPNKAKEKLGWVPEITLDEMVQETVASRLGTRKAACVFQRTRLPLRRKCRITVF